MSFSCVSIIIPIFNSSKYIEKTLSTTILACSDLIFEIILIDDHSDDIELIKEIIGKFESVILIQKENKTNAADSRNIGFLNSRYDLVFFLDADDEYNIEYIKHRVSLMTTTSSGVYFGGFLLNVKNQKKVKFCLIYNNENMRDYIFVRRGDFRTSTISINKTYHNGTLFDSSQYKHQDWGYGIRCYDANETITYDKELLVQINCGMNEQMSNSMNILASKYFINTYLIDSKYHLAFINIHLLNAFNNRDHIAIDYFISLIKKCNAGIRYEYMYKILLILSKTKLRPFISFVLRVFIKIRRLA